MLKIQERAEPRLFGQGKQFDIHPTLGTTDHRTDSNREDVRKRMNAVGRTRIR